jgi:hypothetical protein
MESTPLRGDEVNSQVVRHGETKLGKYNYAWNRGSDENRSGNGVGARNRDSNRGSNATGFAGHVLLKYPQAQQNGSLKLKARRFKTISIPSGNQAVDDCNHIIIPTTMFFSISQMSLYDVM